MYDWADNLTSSQERVMIEPTSEGCGMNHMIQAKGERRGEGIGIIGGGGGEERDGRGEERDMRGENGSPQLGGQLDSVPLSLTLFPPPCQFWDREGSLDTSSLTPSRKNSHL